MLCLLNTASIRSPSRVHLSCLQAYNHTLTSCVAPLDAPKHAYPSKCKDPLGSTGRRRFGGPTPSADWRMVQCYI